MKKIIKQINGKDYRLFEITLFKDSPTEITITVAEEALNKKIEDLIKKEQYHKVKEIDNLYGYWVPQEIADDEIESEIIDSIESVLFEDLEERYPIFPETWESAACPIKTDNVDFNSAEKELFITMYQRGYDKHTIKCHMTNRVEHISQDDKEKFSEILCEEEEKIIINNGGVYYEDIRLTEEEIKTVTEVLKEKEIDFDQIKQDDEKIIITILAGDWKHAHLRLKLEMSELGYTVKESKYLEDKDTDGDSYSARYVFIKQNQHAQENL